MSPFPYEVPERYVTRRPDGWPPTFELDAVYLFYDLGTPEVLAMRCPCGRCGEVMQLNLRPAVAQPHWTLTEHEDDTVSLAEVVFATCGARFRLTRNVVEGMSSGQRRLNPEPG